MFFFPVIRHLMSNNQIKSVEEISSTGVYGYIDFGTKTITVVDDKSRLIVDTHKVNEEFSRLMEEEEAQKRRELEYALKSNLIIPMLVSEDRADLQPPAKAQSILSLLLEAKDREVVIGDLIERYGIKIEQRGKLRADLWFYRQVVWSVWPLLQRTLVKLRRLGVVR